MDRLDGRGRRADRLDLGAAADLPGATCGPADRRREGPRRPRQEITGLRDALREHGADPWRLPRSAWGARPPNPAPGASADHRAVRVDVPHRLVPRAPAVTADAPTRRPDGRDDVVRSVRRHGPRRSKDDGTWSRSPRRRARTPEPRSASPARQPLSPPPPAAFCEGLTAATSRNGGPLRGPSWRRCPRGRHHRPSPVAGSHRSCGSPAAAPRHRRRSPRAVHVERAPAGRCGCGAGGPGARGRFRTRGTISHGTGPRTGPGSPEPVPPTFCMAA